MHSSLSDIFASVGHGFQLVRVIRCSARTIPTIDVVAVSVDWGFQEDVVEVPLGGVPRADTNFQGMTVDPVRFNTMAKNLMVD